PRIEPEQHLRRRRLRGHVLHGADFNEVLDGRPGGDPAALAVDADVGSSRSDEKVIASAATNPNGVLEAAAIDVVEVRRGLVEGPLLWTANTRPEIHHAGRRDLD